MRIVPARHAQALQEVEELLGGHPDSRGHLILELAPAAAHLASGVHGLVHLVFDDLARNPVTPTLGVHALGPEIVGLHHVAVPIHDQRRLGHAGSPLFSAVPARILMGGGYRRKCGATSAWNASI